MNINVLVNTEARVISHILHTCTSYMCVSQTSVWQVLDRNGVKFSALSLFLVIWICGSKVWSRNPVFND